MDDNNNSGNIMNDAPIDKDDQDILGYKSLALYLLNDLDLTDVKQHAYSIGITAPWGTGKSSFLNLLNNRINEQKAGVVIRFYPRSSHHVELIQDDFFKTFSESIGKYHTGISVSIARYVRALKIMESDGALYRVSEFFKSISIEDEKEYINYAIKQIGKKIYVIIEDLDRLSGKEILEVLKLIDRNGDFCNVFFLSAYDKQYVNDVLRKELGHNMMQYYTDKYFCYELSLPVQKRWTVKNYIRQYLQTVQLDTNISNYRTEIIKEWDKKGDKIVSSLGTIREAKRYINLFMSRFAYVMDDVNVGDFFILTLIRYKNIAVYDSISRCDFLRKSTFLEGGNGNLILTENYQEIIKGFVNSEEITQFIGDLFPSPQQESIIGNNCKCLRRIESFDIYFYDRYRSRIYYSDIQPIFEEKDE